MNQVLLTVSGEIDPQIEAKIARGERPEADYIAMARVFEADLMDYTGARRRTGWLGKLLEPLLGPNLTLAWACFLVRSRYRVIFTDGEQIGLPLAFFLKFLAPGAQVRHLMIVHILSVWKKALLVDVFRLWRRIDIFFVYATRQKEYILSRWPLPADRVVFTPFMVDARFFSPDRVTEKPPLDLEALSGPLICAVGLEFRDYPTLLEAIQGVEVTLVIAAGSPWSKRADSTQRQDLPENVIVCRFSQYDLRSLYQASAFVVMPLYNVQFQAGVTAILEAMAMKKAVICSQTPGQTDILVAGESGVYVPPEDPAALRSAILDLLDHPQKAHEMGHKARQQVLEHLSLEHYATRLASYVARTAGSQPTER